MAKTKVCKICWVKLVKKNSVPNGAGGIRNLCRTHRNEYQRNYAAKKKWNVIKEVEAPPIHTVITDFERNDEVLVSIETNIKDAVWIRQRWEETITEYSETIDELLYWKRRAIFFTKTTVLLSVLIIAFALLYNLGILSITK